MTGLTMGQAEEPFFADFSSKLMHGLPDDDRTAWLGIVRDLKP